MTTLGDELPAQMARVRDLLIPAYLECGIGGTFAVGYMFALYVANGRWCRCRHCVAVSAGAHATVSP